MTLPTPGDFAAALSQGLMRELLIRLQAAPCEHCGRSAVTTQELDLIRKFIADSDLKALKDSATLAVRGTIADNLPFMEPAYLPPSPEPLPIDTPA